MAAKGRMLNRVIASSYKFNCLLEHDFERLLFLLLTPFSDVEGRLEGDSCLVKSMCFPRRRDITYDQVEDALKILNEVGLIKYYQVENEWYIQISNFHNQQRVDRSKEKATEIPEPPDSGNSPPEPEESPPEPGESPPEPGESRQVELAINTNNKINNNNKENESSLYASIKEVFEAEQLGGKFTDYGKEGKAIKGLIKKAKNLVGAEAPDVFLFGMINTYSELRNSDKFYRAQPYLPSALNSSGIWDRVLTAAQNNHKENVRRKEILAEMEEVII